MEQSRTIQLSLSQIVFMVLSAMLTIFFGNLFYIAYWQWVPVYEASGVEPLWWIFYEDPAVLLIFPTAFFLIITLAYFRRICKQRA